MKAGAVRMYDPEYYSNQYRCFQEYARNYSGYPIKKIACGPNSVDYKLDGGVPKEYTTSYIVGKSHYTIIRLQPVIGVKRVRLPALMRKNILAGSRMPCIWKPF